MNRRIRFPRFRRVRFVAKISSDWRQKFYSFRSFFFLLPSAKTKTKAAKKKVLNKNVCINIATCFPRLCDDTRETSMFDATSNDNVRNRILILLSLALIIERFVSFFFFLISVVVLCLFSSSIRHHKNYFPVMSWRWIESFKKIWKWQKLSLPCITWIFNTDRGVLKKRDGLCDKRIYQLLLKNKATFTTTRKTFTSFIGDEKYLLDF